MFQNTVMFTGRRPAQITEHSPYNTTSSGRPRCICDMHLEVRFSGLREAQADATIRYTHFIRELKVCSKIQCSLQKDGQHRSPYIVPTPPQVAVFSTAIYSEEKVSACNYCTAVKYNTLKGLERPKSANTSCWASSLAPVRLSKGSRRRKLRQAMSLCLYLQNNTQLKFFKCIKGNVQIHQDHKWTEDTPRKHGLNFVLH